MTLRLLAAAAVFSMLARPGLAQRAQPLSLPSYSASYSETKSWLDSRARLPRTSTERINDLHSVVKARIGQKGLDNLFGEPALGGKAIRGSGKLTLPIETPGLQRAVLASSFDNWRVAAGHRRTLVYAERLNRSGSFRIDGINSPFSHTIEGTPRIGDQDLQLTSRRTGRRFAVEVKDRKGLSLRRSLNELKQQIDKEISVARAENRQYVFVNRKAVPLELQQYIENRGGLCLENVPSKDIARSLEQLDRPTFASRLRVSGGVALAGVGLAGGVFEMYSSGLRIGSDVETLWNNPEADATAVHLRLAESGLRFTSGAIGVTESVAGGLVMMGIGTGSKIATTYIPGVGMVVAPVLVVGEGAIAYSRWRYGYMSDAEFRYSMYRVGVQTGGMAVGGTIGAFFGGPLGAGIGMGIGYGVASVGVIAYEWWSPPNRGYGLIGTMTAREQEEYRQFVVQRYAAK